MKLFLVRHGQTAWNVTNRAQGHADISLDETGAKQARLLCEHLKTLGIERVLCSDLVRCQETVQCFLEDSRIEVELRRDLRERTFGEMEGDDYHNLHKWMRDQANLNGLQEYAVRPPGGESMVDVWNRLESVYQELVCETRPTLVVSHGGALAQLLAKLLRGTAETPRSFRFSNCGVASFDRREDGSMFLLKFNDCTHLVESCESSPVA